MSKPRNFEVGDLAVYNGNVGTVTYIFTDPRVINCVCVTFWESTAERQGNSVHIRLDGHFDSYDWGDDCFIKHIRKPRKGSKEARDIVAMLGRESNRTHNAYIRQLKHGLSSYQQDYDNFEDDSEIVESKNQLLCLIENQKEYIRKAYKNKKFYALGDLHRKAKSMLKCHETNR